MFTDMGKFKLSKYFNNQADAVFFHGDCLSLLSDIPSDSMKLVVTSPPYNVGKEYEKKTSKIGRAHV